MMKSIRLSDIRFVILSAFFITLTQNMLFFLSAYDLTDIKTGRDVAFLISFFLATFLFLNICFSILLLPFIRKGVLIVFLLIGSVVTYFMYAYNIVIDEEMIRNTFQTTAAESLDLLSWRLILFFVLFGLAPSVLVVLIKFKSQSRLRMMAARGINIVMSLLLLFLCAFVFYKDYASFFRNNKWVLKQAVPSNYIAGVINLCSDYLESKREFVQIGLDAAKGDLIKSQEKSTLLVVVVGETARSESFSLGDYKRITNPNLAQQNNLFYFKDVTSCATSTATALPCMFSDTPRAQFNTTDAKYKDNVLDIIYRTDVDMLWLENDGGSKGVSSRIPTIDVSKYESPLCDGDTCYDEILLPDLENFIRTLEGDGVIILHQIGSHGPSYHKRYPDEFRQFTPTCDMNTIKDCETQALLNTYDNTVLYTDYILSQVVTILQENEDRFNTAMLYISDHGESLGEKGMFLHATPYLMAPDQQLKVPLIMWFSQGYIDGFGLDTGCVEKRAADGAFSQDNMFHSLLGMMDIQTSLYDSKLDILQQCRAK